MSKGILTKCQGGRSITKIVASKEGAIGSDFSKQVIPLRACVLWRYSHFRDLIGGVLYRGPQCSFCIVQPAFHARVWRIHIQGPGISQAQTGPRANHLVWELL